MKSWKMPTPDEVAKATALLARPEQYRYFFDQLQNPLWIRPLTDKGWFRHPPPPGPGDGPDSRSFSPWPESRYLARMAALPEAYEDVRMIALDIIPETENVRVHEDLSEIALNLPPAMAAQFVPRAQGWIQSPFQLLLPDRLGALVSHLARGAEVEAALLLAESLLDVVPDRSEAQSQPASEGYRPPPEVRARFSPWDYGEIVEKHMPDLVEAAGSQALDLLSRLLDKAIGLSLRDPQRRRPSDSSYVWRHSIEGDQAHRHGVKDILVTAVRDAAVQLARHDENRVPELIAALEGDGTRWLVFQRIALHLLRLFPDAAPDLVNARLTDSDLFHDICVRHEYYLLSRECFARLGEDGRQKILAWIEAGPDPEAVKAHGERYRKAWQRDRLAPLGGSLDQHWQKIYDDLRKEVGPPDHPEYPVYVTSGSHGPRSPALSR